MKDIIGSRRPPKPKKDKKGKKKVSLTKAPSSGRGPSPTGVTFREPIVDVSTGDSEARGFKALGKRSAEDALPPSPKACQSL